MTESICKIPIAVPNMQNLTVLSAGECYLELFSDRVVQEINYKCEDAIDDDDLSLGYEERAVHCYSVLYRSACVGAEVVWQYKSKTYRVNLLTNPQDAGYAYVFKKKQEAHDAHKKLIDWIFSK